jgi:anti-sigma factor RsiW
MKHWTETDFRNWLYGLKEPDPHLEQCPECRIELERLERERRRITAQPEVSHEFLAAQRRAVYRRLDERPSGRVAMRWLLSAAMLLVMLFGFTIQRWLRPAQSISDEQLFSDLTAIDQRAEPAAIQPIHALFEQ